LRLKTGLRDNKRELLMALEGWKFRSMLRVGIWTSASVGTRGVPIATDFDPLLENVGKVKRLAFDHRLSPTYCASQMHLIKPSLTGLTFVIVHAFMAQLSRGPLW
jgi:hypothetical protein